MADLIQIEMDRRSGGERNPENAGSDPGAGKYWTAQVSPNTFEHAVVDHCGCEVVHEDELGMYNAILNMHGAEMTFPYGAIVDCHTTVGV